MLADRLRQHITMAVVAARTFLSGYPLLTGVIAASTGQGVTRGADYTVTNPDVYIFSWGDFSQGNYFYAENIGTSTVQIRANYSYAFTFYIPAGSRIMLVIDTAFGYGKFHVSSYPAPL